MSPSRPDLGPLLMSALDAVVAVDGRGVVTGWNDVATRTFGWTREQAEGQTLAALIIPPQHRKNHETGMRRYQQTGEARVVNRRIEITAIDRHGREFPVELAIVATPDMGESHFLGFLRDISDRRSAQDRLTLSEESLRLTTDAAEIGTWDLDLRTNMLTWSDRTKAMFGISAGVPCTMEDFYEGLHPEDRPATAVAFASAIDPKVRAQYDVQYRTIGKEDGRVRWVAAKGRGLFDAEGYCTRAVGTAIDITARKLADARQSFMLELSDVLRGSDTDQALNQACALMGRYFAAARVGYGHLDSAQSVFDYVVCWTDGSVPPLLGELPAAAFGRKIVAKLGAGETVVINDLLNDSLSDELETRATASSVATRAILVVPFLRAGRLRTIVYLNDRPARRWTYDEIEFMQEVAERTRQTIERGEAEAALRQLNANLEARVEQRTYELRSAEEALRQAQKMDAIGQLTGGIAHDFNNLLQGITGSLQVVKALMQRGRLEEVDRFLNGAISSAYKAAAVTDRLLAFARRQPLDSRAVQANPLVTAMADLLRRTLGEKVDLRLSLTEPLWLTWCDPNQLENAVLNLAINARDAMAEGGTLTIRTDNFTAAQVAETPWAGLRPGDFVKIEVVDTGVGMDADTVSRAFEPFFTTKPVGQGTGLGLSMVYGFVRQSGGYTRIDSERGTGTRIAVCLPRFVGELPAEPDRPSEIASASSGEVVLVVEDDTTVRSLIVEVLAQLGYKALEAPDGTAGLAVLQSSERIDLLISDIGLPGIDGRELANRARARRPDLKVLLMTGYAESLTSNVGLADPAMTLIRKPFSIDALAARIRSIFD